jgi:sigma-B regulation protein RsbU (phosphoserine phosphatase)
MTIMDQVPAPDGMTQSQMQQQIHALLLGDADNIILGTIIFVAGLAAILVSCVRLKLKAGLLLWFGLIALLYGVRLLADTDTVHLLVGMPETFWRYLISFIGHLILIPFVLFFEQIYGKGWKSSLRGLLWIQALYAVAAILTDTIQQSPESLPDPVYLFFSGLTAILVLGRYFAYQPPLFEESRAISVGLFIFILFVVNEHLVIMGLVPWSLRIEPLGFLLFVILLGFIAVRRFIINEHKLAALQHEMDAAQRIQASILPRELPSMKGCRLAVRYVPMASVAGDYYDFVTVDGARLGVLIADVAGHGVPAALIASMVKVALSSQVSCWSDPAAVVSGLNQVLCKQQTGQFVTAGYLLLDLKEKTAFYSGAAHPPLLLWRGLQKEILQFQENGLPLGFRPHETYASVPIRLVPGDRILMYTDGIIETAHPSGDLFGEERFKAFIKEYSNLPADRFADSLLHDLAAWSGRKAGRAQEDDVTLIVADID